MSVLFSCLYGDLEPKRRIILRRKAVIDGVTVIIQLDAVAVAVRCAVLVLYQVVNLLVAHEKLAVHLDGKMIEQR